MKNIFFPVLALTVLLFIGCDKVDNPIPYTAPVNTDGLTFDTSIVESSPTMRKIVLEEFTGHRCSQCPTGAAEIANLVSTYGSQLIPVSMHAGWFAQPWAPGSGQYETDFRTNIGETFNGFGLYAPLSYPAGMVSRIEDNGSITNGQNDWDNIIQTIVNDVPKVSIKITNLYNDSARVIKEIVETEWLSTEPNSYKLQVYLLEDHITDWQLSGVNDIATYDHRHVIRKALNSDFGTVIPSSSIGNTDLQEFTFEIPIEWNVDECIIVALVYDVTTQEILQGEEIHIK